MADTTTQPTTTQRDLNAEKAAVDKFNSAQGRLPSTPDDWKNIATSVYGTNLPADLQQKLGGTQQPAQQPQQQPSALNYMGSNVSDQALGQAQQQAGNFNAPNFLDKVKFALQEKFQPGKEQMGMGAFSSSLQKMGVPFTPQMYSQGQQEQQNEWTQKGQLALQALTTANNIYSTAATNAQNHFNDLMTLRQNYDAKQQAFQSTVAQTIQGIAQMGEGIPQDLINALPPEQRQFYQGLGKFYKDQAINPPVINDGKDVGTNADNGWTGDEVVVATCQPGQENSFECGTYSRSLGDYAQGNPMGNTLQTKEAWVDKYGKQGTGGLQVGDLVITDGSDVSSSGQAISTGHALIVGDIGTDGQIYAYEANAKGTHAVTFGRKVNPNAIYGYVSGTMNPNAKAQMVSAENKWLANISKSGVDNTPTSSVPAMPEFDNMEAQGITAEKAPAYFEKIYPAKTYGVNYAATKSSQYTNYLAQKQANPTDIDSFQNTPDRPDASVANKVDSTTGLSLNAIYQDALNFATQGKLPPVGMGSGAKAMAIRTAIQNKAGAIAAAAGIDLPTLQAEYKANSAALSKLMPTYNQIMVNEQTASKNLDLAQQLAAKLPEYGSQFANKVARDFANNYTGNADTQPFVNAMLTAASEYAKVVSGGVGSTGLTDSAREEGKQRINYALTHGQLDNTIKVMKQEMANVRGSWENQLGGISTTMAQFTGAMNPKTTDTEDPTGGISLNDIGFTFQNHKGADNYISPTDWNAIKSQWVAQGGEAATFNDMFKVFKNPNNKYYM